MSAPDLSVGQRFLERYDILRVLERDPEWPAWVVFDRDAGVRRELRCAPDTFDDDEALVMRRELGPYVIGVHGVEYATWLEEEQEHKVRLVLLDHYSQSIELSTLAGTWQGVLVGVLAQIAEGLEALHAAGRTLGVLTPRSVSVVSAAGGFVPVLDDVFAWRPKQEDLVGPWVTGDAAFAAPELLRAEAHASSASDIFSFGVLTAHAFTGCMPFRDEGSAALAGRGPSVLARRPRVLSSATVDLTRVTPVLRDIIAPCMAVDASQRPSAESLRRALKAQCLPDRTVSTLTQEPSAGARSVSDEPEARAAPAEFLFDMSALSAAGEHEELAPGVGQKASEPRAKQGTIITPEAPAPSFSKALSVAFVLLALVFSGGISVYLFGGTDSTPSRDNTEPMQALSSESLASDAREASEVRSELGASSPASGASESPEPPPLPPPLAERRLHAALPALGCVGAANVYHAGPPLVLDLPCHLRCIVTLDDEGTPTRLVRCRGAEAVMTGDGPELRCTRGRVEGALRCTAALTLLLGEEEKRIVDTLTLRITP